MPEHFCTPTPPPLALLSMAAVLAAASLSCPAGSDCGDGLHDPGEECDDGNTLSGDGCNPSCRLECGNGLVDTGEECDDGNRDPDDGCDSSCALECGNGVLDGGEECDPSLTSGCGPDCRWEGGPDGDADVDLPEPGTSVSLPGELTADGASWHRPDATCEQLESFADSFAYQGLALHNAAGRQVSVTIDARASGAGIGTLTDTMLFLYPGQSLPADPLTCLTSDDDGGEGVDARLTAVPFAEDQDAFLVITAFAGLPGEVGCGTYELVVAVE